MYFVVQGSPRSFPIPTGNSNATPVPTALSPKPRAATATTAAGHSGTPPPVPRPSTADRETSVTELKAWAWYLNSETNLARFLQKVFGKAATYGGFPAASERRLHDGHLEYGQLLRRAMAWDRLGPSSPMDFVDAIACEAIGNPASAAVNDVLDSLGTT